MSPSAIELDSVRKAYGDGATATVALEGVNLAVAPGRFVSLIGPSGCGKSTLLRIAAGLEDPDRGTVRVHGVTPAEACAAKLIGFVPQAPALLPWLTVARNVTLPQKINPGAGKRRARISALAGRDTARTVPSTVPATMSATVPTAVPASGASEPDAMELLRKAGLGDAADKLPAELSGGMRQRAAIVRAFALRPDVLLMDEPFSALDEFTREALQDQLLALWADLATTIVFVTHSVSEAVRLSDSVVVMAPRPGRIVDVVDVDLPRPRDQGDQGDRGDQRQGFHDYEDLIRDKLRSAWRSADAA